MVREPNSFIHRLGGISSGASPIPFRDSKWHALFSKDLEQVYEERLERAYRFYRPYLRSVIYRYLDCSILHNGFARVRC
jgi:hypothetical protein